MPVKSYIMTTLITPCILPHVQPQSNLLFSAADVTMTTQDPAATLKHDKHKSQKINSIDLASLHETDVKTDSGV